MCQRSIPLDSGGVINRHLDGVRQCIQHILDGLGRERLIVDRASTNRLFALGRPTRLRRRPILQASHDGVPSGTLLELIQHHIPQLAPLAIRNRLAAARAARRVGVAEHSVSEEGRLGEARAESRAARVVQLYEREEVGRAQTEERRAVLGCEEVERERARRRRTRVLRPPKVARSGVESDGRVCERGRAQERADDRGRTWHVVFLCCIEDRLDGVPRV